MEIGDLKETAGLAHLNLGDEELAAAFPAFEQMLSFFAAMQAADTDESLFSPAGAAKNVLPSGQNAGARMVESGFFRADDPPVQKAGSHNLNESLLNNAGGRDGRFLVIPNVL
ncbi:MAG: aspartyl/glutamyl-tRNA amidotransferase subunit C [Treponema sp.]|jgi:aspartyl-tRNA(Asn)/glutamyl-tRNA(Gln) amidotransferase subunit C|nr:aspartyl/glutamyl-tRNA amidotransferase subunit C [Treponema sp.]